jgi:predicted  nucleic acid-binding Zn-ribbon protein
VSIDWGAELRRLLAVQAVDQEIDRLEADRRALQADAETARLERQVRADRAEERSLQASLAETERRGRLAELERQSLEAERERNTQRLYGGAVKSPRDIEGLQKNIEGASERISALETTILESMEMVDELRKRLTQVRDRIAQGEAALESRRLWVQRRLGEIERLLPRLAAERQEALDGIAPAVVREYERIRRRAQGIAVAVLREGACTGCGVEVSPRLVAEVRRGQAPVTCEHCGRLLVEVPAEAAPGVRP